VQDVVGFHHQLVTCCQDLMLNTQHTL